MDCTTFQILLVVVSNNLYTYIKTSLLSKLSFEGFVDGCYIKIRKPSYAGDHYINRKKCSAVTLQCVCTRGQYIIDMHVGDPSVNHDWRVFRNSALGRHLHGRLEGTPYHLVGDMGYKLGYRLMVPFKNDHPLQEV